MTADGVAIRPAREDDLGVDLAGRRLHLDCLFVREQTRDRRVGRALVRAVQADARRACVEELQWQTPEWNGDAIRFYRRTGAREAAKMRSTLPLTAQPTARRSGTATD